MNDKKFIIAGLIIFFAAALTPFWFNFGKAAPAPEPELSKRAEAAKYCVLPNRKSTGVSKSTPKDETAIFMFNSVDLYISTKLFKLIWFNQCTKQQLNGNMFNIIALKRIIEFLFFFDSPLWHKT